MVGLRNNLSALHSAWQKCVDLDECVQKWKVDEMVFGEMTSWWNGIAPKENKVSMAQRQKWVITDLC
jgi:hypothetical protein